MERRKLTKEDIDKVRNIEGFPIGTDEDIIALSDAPFYTACPNPFIEDFIKEYGTPYDETTDDYHREPFAADVSEGKHDPMYMAHSYHTKVPYRAIMHYILHYTNPGDLILDGFSGTGMTGVAAQMCGSNDYALQYELKKKIPNLAWGTRSAILSDLSPEAAFISYNYNTEFSAAKFTEAARKILDESRKECGWMYQTRHEQAGAGEIEYTVWSDVYICPNCGQEINYWKTCVLPGNKVVTKPKCPKCMAVIDKNKCEHAQDMVYDERLGKTITPARQVPVKIFYSYNGKRYSKPM